MGIDPELVAAVSLDHRRLAGHSCDAGDVTFQLSLAHVLLDGGYDGVATLSEVLPAGDLGLGTVDRLDGELVVVDGEPWRVDHTGRAELLSVDTRTPFAVLTSMDDPISTRIRGVDLDGVCDAIDALVQPRTGVIAIVLEGVFSNVTLRSVKAQEPPYRPFAEVLATDEVRWEHERFEGVFVGFCFPDLQTPDIIGGLHLHGLDDARSTGGHNYALRVEDAKLSVETSHEIALTLPDRSMIELLELPAELRSVQRELLRSGALDTEALAQHLGIGADEAVERIEWLADRGFVGADASGRWQITMRSHSPRMSERLEGLLDGLIDSEATAGEPHPDRP
jgi:acetolactate decarboxylase